MELRTARTADVIVPIVLRQSIEVSGAAVGQVFRVEPASGDLLLWGWHPPDLPFSLGQKVRHRVGEGAAGHVAATGEIHIAKDITHDPLARILPEEADVIRQIHGGISLPLRTSEGQIVGVMQLGWVERRTYPPEEVRLLTSIAEVASNALHRAQLFETLEQRVAERTAELQAVNLRLADLERLKSQFLANASHELRTPLTNIKAYLDLLERGRVERQPHYLNVLKREADVLHQLVENLLDVAQLDYGRVQPKLAAVDLNQLLSVTLETCAILVSDRNLHLQTETGPGLLMVTADVKMLRQVITNLVSYVADQMPSGATVVLRTGQQSNETGHWATLGVYATGLTLRDLEQSRPADAGENRSFMPGGGLRLSICQEIVARLGGKIAGQAQEGQPGIVIRLPAGK
jgi:signal transduction histidine kinase